MKLQPLSVVCYYLEVRKSNWKRIKASVRFCPSSNNSTHHLMMRQQLFLMTATHLRRRSVSKRNGGSLRNRRETLRGKEWTSQRLLFAWGERYSSPLMYHNFIQRNNNKKNKNTLFFFSTEKGLWGGPCLLAEESVFEHDSLFRP